MDADDILDPAHDDSLTGTTNAGVAGIAAPEPAADDKDGKVDLTVSDDGNIVKHNGRTYITQEALHAERKQRQELADTLARLDPVMPEFQEFLANRESRRNNTRDRVATDTGGVKDDPEYLNEVAIALGLYDEQNQPDARRAQAHLNVTRREANRAADARVRPLAETTARDRAAANRNQARSNTYVDGKPVAHEKYLNAAYDAITPEMAADPNISNVTQIIAAGLEYLEHRKNGTLPGGQRGGRGREPMLLERGGNRFEGTDDGLSELDLAAARARGKSPEQWSKLSKQVNRADGRASNRGTAVLEDV